MGDSGGSSGFGQAVIDVHGNYRASRLEFEPPDELISDVVTARVLRPHLVRSMLFLVTFIILFLLTLVVLALGLSEMTTSWFGLLGGPTEKSLAQLQFFVEAQFAVLVFWLLSLFRPVRESISEYGLLIEGRASTHSVAYDWVAETVSARRTPFGVTQSTIEGWRVVLFRNGRERGLVVVRPWGSDLYVGWTMWRERSTIMVLAHIVRDLLQASNPASDVRAASSRALRELIHSVTREGVQAAISHPADDPTSGRNGGPSPNQGAMTGPGLISEHSVPASPTSGGLRSPELGLGVAMTPPDYRLRFASLAASIRSRARRSPRRLVVGLCLLLLAATVGGGLWLQQPRLAAEDADRLYERPLVIAGASFSASTEGDWNLADWETREECASQWNAWTSTLKAGEGSAFATTQDSVSWIGTYVFSGRSDAEDALAKAAPAWTACYPPPDTAAGVIPGKVSGATWHHQIGSDQDGSFEEVFVQYGNTFTVSVQGSGGQTGADHVGSAVAQALIERIDDLD